MCDLHYRRWKRHGDANKTLRPSTWGQNNGHPLWDSWKWTKRLGRVPEWNDFWVFVADVGERPTPTSRLKKRHRKQPAGPENCYWAELVSTIDNSSRESRAAYQRQWRAKNPLKAKQNDLRKMFGIDLAEYARMLDSQNGGCAICGKTDKHYRLAVDHCHDKGHVRGLLCADCNRGLGLFKDSPDLLTRAAEYLR